MKPVNKQAAFTFIEVLISLLLLNITLCGLLKTQLFLIKRSSATYLNTIATIQAANLLELLHLKKQTHANISTLLHQWQEHTQNLLPKITSQHHCALNQCHVLLRWQFHGRQQVTLLK